MPFDIDRNTSYGGPTVTQKYSPLEKIKYEISGKEEQKRFETACSALLTNRANLLSSARVLPQVLLLCTDWTTILSPGPKQDPPLVVISTNRSKWIAAGAEAAKNQLVQIRYAGSHDLNALTAQAGQKQSPPLYVPQRVEGTRKVFIVVHMFEYLQYRKALADTTMIVVGWSFKTPVTPRGPLTGFGASRYAAIEFCKHLRAKMPGEKWNYAWLLDDNVVGLTGFPGYEPVETAIAAGTTERICAGFQGSSSAEGHAAIKSWAEGRAASPKPTLPAPTRRADDPVLIQQVVLWNIKYLTENYLNFSPVFLLSGEDISFGNYFHRKEIPYLYYEGIRVRKESVSQHDYNPEARVHSKDGAGAKKVAEAKDAYVKWFAEEEANRPEPPVTPPPPVEVKRKETRGPVQTLSEFITSWFTTASPSFVKGASELVQNNAKCQAVEQMACAAIKQTFVSDDALDRTFKLHPNASQNVKRHLPPVRR